MKDKDTTPGKRTQEFRKGERMLWSAGWAGHRLTVDEHGNPSWMRGVASAVLVAATDEEADALMDAEIERTMPAADGWERIIRHKARYEIEVSGWPALAGLIGWGKAGE